MTIEELRKTLGDRKGSWVRIATKAGCNRKTIERIMNQTDYLPSVRTLLDLERALAEMPASSDSKEAA